MKSNICITKFWSDLSTPCDVPWILSKFGCTRNIMIIKIEYWTTFIWSFVYSFFCWWRYSFIIFFFNSNSALIHSRNMLLWNGPVSIYTLYSVGRYLNKLSAWKEYGSKLVLKRLYLCTFLLDFIFAYLY